MKIHKRVLRDLGIDIPSHHPVHHFDGNRKNNKPGNLIVCEDDSYHWLLEMRTHALKVCGNSRWKRCKRCGKYDDPKNMHEEPDGRHFYHKKCQRAYDRKRYKDANPNAYQRMPW